MTHVVVRVERPCGLGMFTMYSTRHKRIDALRWPEYSDLQVIMRERMGNAHKPSNWQDRFGQHTKFAFLNEQAFEQCLRKAGLMQIDLVNAGYVVKYLEVKDYFVLDKVQCLIDYAGATLMKTLTNKDTAIPCLH